MQENQKLVERVAKELAQAAIAQQTVENFDVELAYKNIVVGLYSYADEIFGIKTQGTGINHNSHKFLFTLLATSAPIKVISGITQLIDDTGQVRCLVEQILRTGLIETQSMMAQIADELLKKIDATEYVKPHGYNQRDIIGNLFDILKDKEATIASGFIYIYQHLDELLGFKWRCDYIADKRYKLINSVNLFSTTRLFMKSTDIEELYEEEKFVFVSKVLEYITSVIAEYTNTLDLYPKSN